MIFNARKYKSFYSRNWNKIKSDDIIIYRSLEYIVIHKDDQCIIENCCGTYFITFRSDFDFNKIKSDRIPVIVRKNLIDSI